MLATQKRLFLFVGLVFAVVATSLSISLLNHQRVYADYTVGAGQKCQNGSNPTTVPGATPTFNCTESTRTGTDQQIGTGGTDTQTGTPSGADNNSDVTCAVEKVGWIICPILESMAKISDNMFDVLANNFLRTDTALFRDDSGTKTAWEIARNLANVMFIVAFLAIIISQVTNMGINNYGIKKMLPRLVIAAIAVNVSYYICQLVVDLTNILGFEIQNALVQIADGIGPSVFGNASEWATGGGAGTSASDVGVLTVIAVAALASTAVWLILGPGLAVITVAIITILAIIVILLLRKALIVLLIVISPIAFVLYLLPNTEKFFSKWMKMFGQLLMVFPVVGLLFGAGQLASTIILVSGAQTPPSSSQECNPDANANNTPGGIADKAGITYDGKCDGFINIEGTRKNPADESKNLGGKGVSWTLGLVAMGVAVAPLMAVYAVLKGALSAAGAIGGTINAMTKRGAGAGGKFSKDMDERRQKRIQASTTRPDGSRLGKALNIATAGSYRRRAKRDAIDKNLDREVNMAKLDYTSQEVLGSKGFERQMAGGSRFIPGSADESAMNRAQAAAVSQQQALQQEEMKAAHVTVDRMVPNELVGTDEATGNVTGAGALLDALRNHQIESASTAAMIERVMQAGSAKQKEAIVDALRGIEYSLATRTASSALAQNNPGYMSATQLDKIKLGRAAGSESYRDMSLASIAQNRFTPEKMADANAEDVEYARTISQGTSAAHASAMANLNAAAQEAMSNVQIRGRIKNNIGSIQRMQQNDFDQGQPQQAPPPQNTGQGTLF